MASLAEPQMQDELTDLARQVDELRAGLAQVQRRLAALTTVNGGTSQLGQLFGRYAPVGGGYSLEDHAEYKRSQAANLERRLQLGKNGP